MRNIKCVWEYTCAYVRTLYIGSPTLLAEDERCGPEGGVVRRYLKTQKFVPTIEEESFVI